MRVERMIFRETKLAGVFIVEPDRFEDERGFFARTWSRREFSARGLESEVVECNSSFNIRQGTVRGMHYQVPPHSQAKIVSCPRGSIYDAIVDLRPASPTFKEWVAVELTQDNRTMLYVPTECAHGFQTLTDNAEVAYQMFAAYAPEHARGVRWNDPAFNISWPDPKKVFMNQRDRDYPDFQS
jgi:dTDP-4-dehydrorhamnose 3,5-epimerase